MILYDVLASELYKRWADFGTFGLNQAYGFLLNHL